MATLKKPVKISLIVLAVAVGIGGIIWWRHQPKAVNTTQEVGKVSVPDAPEAALTGAAAVQIAFPSKTETDKGGVKAVIQEMEWQSQASIHYANGGIRTTQGSLFEKAGWNVEIKRQDDCSKSTQDMVKYINDYKNGTTKDGFMIIFMGSGQPAYMTGMAQAVKGLGPEYAPVIFLTTGKSYGEDKIIVSNPDILRNPQLLRGKVLRGVRLDGDIDLALKFCGDNNIPINPDPTLYDGNALNLSYSNDYLSAVVDYNNNQTEKRQIIRNGKTTGQDTTVGFDAVATWTPGDANAIKGRGGVTLISTRKYGSVMPNTIVTCKKFLADNRDAVQKLILALGQAGDQIRTFDAAKKYATGLTPLVYDDAQATVSVNGKTFTGADYWYQMYNGLRYNGDITLGGSMVFNLADIAKEFGVNGTSDIYKEIYNTFGTLQSKLYPKDEVFLVTKDKPYAYLPYSQAVDKSYILGAWANKDDNGGAALETQFADKITDTVTKKSVQINFETGSAIINPSSFGTLNDIYSTAVTSGTLKLGVYGYTDNTGNPDKNQQLSEARANAVKQYLLKKGLAQAQVESAGYGDANPIGDNNTAAGKAKNRRVEIVQGE